MDMDPQQASWLVKACCGIVLHNWCLDLGIRKLKPGENRDPTMEAEILIEEAERFRDANEGVGDDDSPAAAAPRVNCGPTYASVVRRLTYVHRNYGGPPPPNGGGGKGRGPGHGCGRGRGRGSAGATEYLFVTRGLLIEEPPPRIPTGYDKKQITPSLELLDSAVCDRLVT